MTKKEKTLRVLKRVGLITYLITTAFLVFMMCLFLTDIDKSNDWWKLGGAVCLVLTLFASILYIMPLTLGIVGIVMSSKIKNKKSIRNSIIMTIAPPATTLINFLLYMLILK